MQLYGNGTAELLHELKDGTIYPVAVTQDGASVSWAVSASDTANIGSGRAELRWYVGDTLAKSAKFRTSVSSALADSTTETPPAPYQSWVDKVLQAAQEIKDGAISDEKLAAAIAAYLEEHPIDAGLDEAALAAHLTENGYLTDAALADAIAKALADAKASGEFNGDPGVDGADGGYYTPSVDDDGNLTWTASSEGMPAVAGVNIRGPQGEAGPAGADGTQGPKGESVTDEQVRSAVDAYANEHGITAGATAEEAAQIEQNTADISSLSEEIENIEYIEGDYKLNTLFNLDFVWFDGIRINSDGSEMSNSSYTTTDYIPVSPDMKIDDFFSSAYQNTFAFYDKKKNFIALATAGESIPDKAAYMRYYTQISTIEATVDSFKTRGTFKFWRQFPTDQTDRNLGIPAEKSLMDTIYNPLKAVATVNFYGDSNTYGYGVDQKSWAYYIAKRLKDTFSGTKLYYYGGSPYVQAWGMNTSSSLATLCLKSLSGSTISDASPFVKFKTNAEKAYCGWVSTSNSTTYAILVDGVVQESGSVTSAGAYEAEITLDGDFHTIMIKPYGNSTINNPYFAIEKQISFNNYGKTGATSQNLPVSGLDTCDYAIVLIGTNDGNNSVYTGVQNGVTFLKFGDHADKCIFIEPLFRCDGKENSHILSNNHISQICDLMGIRHLRLDSLAAIFGLQYAVLMQSDGLHYSTQGHITIANAVSAAMGFATNYKTDYADTDTIGNIFDNLAQ